MPVRHNDFYAAQNHRLEDEHLHAKILADGDHAAAKKVSDQVARDVGLTEAEIEALSAPAPQRGKPK